MRFKSYYIYVLFKFCFSFLFSMATVLSLVYHLKIVGLNNFELIIVGTILETSCFLLEIPTGIVADLYSRRRSIIIGLFLYGIGFTLEGSIPLFGTVLLAQVIWGCGDTFISGALEAWITSEYPNYNADKIFLRGNQISQTGNIIGIIIGTLIGNINLQLPIIISGLLFIFFAIILICIMPETNFSPVRERETNIFKDMIGLFKINLSFIKGAPILLALLFITFCGGLSSEGFDRLSTAHFLENTIMPSVGLLNSITWFGIMNLLSNILGIFISQILIVYLEKKKTTYRTNLIFFTCTGYILSLILFSFGKNFWFMMITFLIAGLMRNLKEPFIIAWINEHTEENMRATIFSTNGQMDSFGQIIGGPIIGLIANQFSIVYGLLCTALFLLPAIISLSITKNIQKNQYKNLQI